MFYVYIIKSEVIHSKIYVGYSTNVKQRLITHNSCGSIYTSKYMPWRLILSIGFETSDQARAFEYYLKTPAGKAFALKRLISV